MELNQTILPSENWIQTLEFNLNMITVIWKQTNWSLVCLKLKLNETIPANSVSSFIDSIQPKRFGANAGWIDQFQERKTEFDAGISEIGKENKRLKQPSHSFSISEINSAKLNSRNWIHLLNLISEMELIQFSLFAAQFEVWSWSWMAGWMKLNFSKIN